MDAESNRWGLSRCAVLFFVVAVHAALLAWLIAALRAPHARAPHADTASSVPVQLLFLPPQILPKIRIDNLDPRRPNSGSPVSIAPPAPDPVASAASESAPISAARDGGSGVDWAAEAKRALQAFEIRSRQPAGHDSVSRRSPAEQPWWPAHRPGERFKTADGNWIVWINSSCYQVATSASSTAAVMPGTICPEKSDIPRADQGDAAR
jgi:hypothetical protein